jgi:hypothetical protein
MNIHVKPFAWSYSKLKNFESCPKRHWHVDLAKDVKEPDSEQLLWGNQVHKALAKRVSLGSALPPGMEPYERWCERVVSGEGNILVEQQLAITRQFGPTEWFGKEAWYRGIADVLKLNGPVALAIDWKTGKILEDPVQLALMAACIFAHHPNVQRIRTEFVWLKEDTSTREDFARDGMATMWKNLWYRIEQLEHAHKTTSYPAKPGYLCRRWCPVKDCPHHGT